MHTLANILEYEYLCHRTEMFNYDKLRKDLYIDLKEIKNDEDVTKFVNQLKRNIAYNAMQMIDNVWYEVKQLSLQEDKPSKKQKIDDENTCSPLGLCKCSKEIPIIMSSVIESH